MKKQRILKWITSYFQAENTLVTLEGIETDVQLSIAKQAIGIISNKHCSFESVKELSKAVAKVKKCCKSFKKSIYLALEECDLEMTNSL